MAENGLRTEKQIREMLSILRAFNAPEGKHDKEIIALSWVLGEYPLTQEKEAEAANA